MGSQPFFLLSPNCKKGIQNPWSPNIHIQILQTDLYIISFKNELREFDKTSKYFLLADHFINSHSLVSWQCMDIIGRKLMLVTTGT